MNAQACVVFRLLSLRDNTHMQPTFKQLKVHHSYYFDYTYPGLPFQAYHKCKPFHWNLLGVAYPSRFGNTAICKFDVVAEFLRVNLLCIKSVLSASLHVCLVK